MSTRDMPWRELKLTSEQMVFCSELQVLDQHLASGDRVQWQSEKPPVLKATPVGLEYLAEAFAGAANHHLEDPIKEEAFASLYRQCIDYLNAMSEEEFYAEEDFPDETP